MTLRFIIISAGTAFLLSCAIQVVYGQGIYFPPLVGDEWETMSIEEAGLCEDGVDSLYVLLDEIDTKAFILLIDGKMVLEKYFGSFEPDSLWYWASAGKTLTAFAVGMAQEQGYLDIHQSSRDHIGEGWSSLTDAQEESITVRHHLTMTTGLDDGVPESDCTLDTCLQFLADPGTRWAYHNAPYTLLDEVISGATGQSLNIYLQTVLKSKTGMDGLFVKLGYNNVYFSTPRSMARFGLLMLNGGIWDNTTVMHDTTYFTQMTKTSQDLNPSYGYLWWLNGQESFMIPGLQLGFDGPLTPEAPADMYSALGKNGQILNIVPSRNLVMIRMGNASTTAAVALTMNSDIWQKLNDASCTTLDRIPEAPRELSIYPNPAREFIRVDARIRNVMAMGADGTKSRLDFAGNTVDVSTLEDGIYFLRVETEHGVFLRKVIIH